MAWAQAGTDSARKLKGAELLQAEQEADLQARLHPDQYYTKLQTAGRDTIDGNDCYRVELTSSVGDITVEYFSTDSGFLTRRTSRVASPVGKIDVTEDFDDYRRVGDRIAWHNSNNHLPGGINVVMNLKGLQFNQPIDGMDFDMP